MRISYTALMLVVCGIIRVGRCAFIRALLVSALVMCAGCSSKGPTIEGAGGIIGGKRIKVGEQFEVTQPFDKDRGAEWRLLNFDSKIIGLVQFEPVRTDHRGEMRRIMRFEGRAPGTSELVFARRETRQWTPGEPLPDAEKRMLRVRVTD